MNIHYVISWYDIDTNILLGEVETDPIPLTDLHCLFKLGSMEGPICESHLIDQQQAQVLSSWLPLVFDFDQYIYQLDCFPIHKELSPVNHLIQD